MQRTPASFWFFQRGAGVPGDRIEQKRASMRRHPRARGLERNVFFMAVFGEPAGAHSASWRASALEKINLEKQTARSAAGDSRWEMKPECIASLAALALEKTNSPKRSRRLAL
jgi:hypothetical protein